MKQAYKVLVQLFKPSGKWYDEEVETIEDEPITYPDGTSFPYGEGVRKAVLKKHKYFYAISPSGYPGQNGYVVVTPYYNDKEGNHTETKSFPTLIKL